MPGRAFHVQFQGKLNDFGIFEKVHRDAVDPPLGIGQFSDEFR
jgi:hypothetical protein